MEIFAAASPTLRELAFPTKQFEVLIERRVKARYPITAVARYRVLKRRRRQDPQEGLIVNIGSAGLLIETGSPLAIRNRVEISMDWPAYLDGRVPLRLLIVGRVLRTEPRSAAIQIDKYEFRTSRATD